MSKVAARTISGGPNGNTHQRKAAMILRCIGTSAEFTDEVQEAWRSWKAEDEKLSEQALAEYRAELSADEGK